jgi:hypothetical protein
MTFREEKRRPAEAHARKPWKTALEQRAGGIIDSEAQKFTTVCFWQAIRH